MRKTPLLALSVLLLSACVEHTSAYTQQRIPESRNKPPSDLFDGESAFAAGMQKMNANDLEAARPLLERAVSQSPDNLKYLTNLGLLYIRAQQGRPAVRTFRHACEITVKAYGQMSARSYGCSVLWATSLQLAGDPGAAATKFEEAYAALMTQTPPAVNDRLMVLAAMQDSLRQAGRGGEVLPLYDRLLADTPASSGDRPAVEKAVATAHMQNR